jgi:hypothetical protein
MKFRSVILIVSILMAGIPACAKVISPRPIFLDRDIKVNGADVSQGMYTLALESHGSSVQATLWREGRFIAAAHGTWVKHSVKYTQDAVLLRVGSDGTRSLLEIRIAGSAKTVVIDSETPILRIAPGPGGGGGKSSTRTIN